LRELRLQTRHEPVRQMPAGSRSRADADAEVWKLTSSMAVTQTERTVERPTGAEALSGLADAYAGAPAPLVFALVGRFEGRYETHHLDVRYHDGRSEARPGGGATPHLHAGSCWLPPLWSLRGSLKSDSNRDRRQRHSFAGVRGRASDACLGQPQQ
jgi:hypothetical protein